MTFKALTSFVPCVQTERCMYSRLITEINVKQRDLAFYV